MALIDKESGNFIGQCGLIEQVVDNIKELKIGYHLLPIYWGEGYATEAAQKMKTVGFENKGTESLISIIHPDNTTSQKVAMRNGMTKTHATTFRDHQVYIYRIRRIDYSDTFNKV